MTHIFVSYSSHDSDYVLQLIEHIEKKGFVVWYDKNMDYSDRWLSEIEKNIDACEAFIVVQTPRSKESKWVPRELTRADRIGKPIFAILREGDFWLQVEDTNLLDLRPDKRGDKKFPDEKFYLSLQTKAPNAYKGSDARVTETLFKSMIREYLEKGAQAPLSRRLAFVFKVILEYEAEGQCPLPKKDKPMSRDDFEKLVSRYSWCLSQMSDIVIYQLHKLLENSPESERQEIYHQLYWGDALYPFVDYEAGESTVNSNVQPTLFTYGFTVSHIPESDREWQENAGELCYEADCEVCKEEFVQTFKSRSEYFAACEQFYDAAHHTFPHLIDICPECEKKLPETAGYVFLLQHDNDYLIGNTQDPVEIEAMTMGLVPENVATSVHLIKSFDSGTLSDELQEKFGGRRDEHDIWFTLTEDDMKYITRLKNEGEKYRIEQFIK